MSGFADIQTGSSGNPTAENLVQINGTTVLAGSGATGTGSQRVTVAVDSATNAGTAPGVKAPNASASVIGAGLQYETVAASQTAQVMGTTGAVGDLMSHVVFQPTTTGAGTCTILDNATVIYTFTTGTLSDLRPIVVPVNAFSVSGAWKITTGANITATAFGSFT